MANATKNNGLGLQETKGSFQLRGVVTGTDKDSFYKEITTKSNKPMRMVNFGINIDKDKAVYVSLNGMEKDTVCFSKSEGKGKDRKTTVEKVKWNDRLSFKKDGFRPIGINLGLKKIVDAKGNEINDKATLFEYDACKHIHDNLTDDVSVFIKGKLEYSTYNDAHQTKFVPNQVSLCKPIDFDDENYEVLGNFEQTIVFMGIDRPDKAEEKFIVTANIITYNSIEATEFIVENPKLAKNLKSLKPYTSIKVYGDIRVERDVDEVVEEDDGWGTSNPMDRVKSPTTRSLVITGADKESIDTELYSEEIIDEAIAKINSNKNADKDYGDNDDWGSAPSSSTATDEDDEW